MYGVSLRALVSNVLLGYSAAWILFQYVISIGDCCYEETPKALVLLVTWVLGIPFYLFHPVLTFVTGGAVERTDLVLVPVLVVVAVLLRISVIRGAVQEPTSSNNERG
jgi:hypothetical protein